MKEGRAAPGLLLPAPPAPRSRGQGPAPPAAASTGTRRARAARGGGSGGVWDRSHGQNAPSSLRLRPRARGAGAEPAEEPWACSQGSKAGPGKGLCSAGTRSGRTHSGNGGVYCSFGFVYLLVFVWHKCPLTLPTAGRAAGRPVRRCPWGRINHCLTLITADRRHEQKNAMPGGTRKGRATGNAFWRAWGLRGSGWAQRNVAAHEC